MGVLATRDFGVFGGSSTNLRGGKTLAKASAHDAHDLRAWRRANVALMVKCGVPPLHISLFSFSGKRAV